MPQKKSLGQTNSVACKEDTMETTFTNRIRVNVDISVKGIITWSSTVEMLDKSLEEVLAESDRLVAALKTRYPLEGTGG